MATAADYRACEDEVARAAARLGRAWRAERRAELLGVLADLIGRQARLHTAVFGPGEDPTAGCPAAEWLADQARMVGVLAEAEQSRVLGLPHEDYWAGLEARTWVLAVAVLPLVERYATGRRRRQLVAAMAGTWRRLSRGPAAEGAWALGSRMPWWLR